MTQTDFRTLPVPDGLAGERVDAAMAQMFGLSRTRAADLIARGLVQVDGEAAAKSDRVLAGATVDVRIPVEADPLAVVPEVVEGIKIIHDDSSIVVIDKPVGVAVHPSPGWTGPTVVGHLAGAGFKIATSGASERQGIVQRLDVGTSGVMVICKSEHAYSVLKNAFRRRDVDKVYHALVQGDPDPLEGTVDAPIGRHPKADYKFAVMADGRPSVTHYSTLEAHRFASLLEVRLNTDALTRSGCTWPRSSIRVSATSPMARTRPWPSGSGWTGSGCTPCASASSTPTRGSTSSTRPTTPPTWPGRWRRSAVPTDDALVLRPVVPEDLPAVAEVHARARDAAYPAMPRSLHPRHEVHAWVAEWDLAKYDVWVAESPEQVVGYARFDREWLECLYVEPAVQGSGVGDALLDLVKAQRPGGFCLWVFESNEPARGSTGTAASSTSSAPTAPPTRRRPPTSAWPGRARIQWRSTAASSTTSTASSVTCSTAARP